MFKTTRNKSNYIAVKTWSASATNETTTGTSNTSKEGHDLRHRARPQTHKQRHLPTNPSSRQQDQTHESRINMYSDSGLGTTALDYAQSGKFLI